MSNTSCITRSCEAQFRNQTAKLTKYPINYCSESFSSEFKTSESGSEDSELKSKSWEEELESSESDLMLRLRFLGRLELLNPQKLFFYLDFPVLIYELDIRSYIWTGLAV